MMTKVDEVPPSAGIVDERNITVAASSAPIATDGACGSGSTFAAAVSAANGTRNFIAAANQIQYRTDAPLLRSINANTAAANPTIVDCQM